jgi:O-methyltransferase involved in polyketide biosynthesis
VERIRVDLHGPPQTMLATLYAKALDADLPNPILGDRYAKEIVDRIDYDWTKTAIAVRNSPSVTTRTAHFDTWARFRGCGGSNRTPSSGWRAPIK